MALVQRCLLLVAPGEHKDAKRELHPAGEQPEDQENTPWTNMNIHKLDCPSIPAPSLQCLEEA